MSWRKNLMVSTCAGLVAVAGAAANADASLPPAVCLDDGPYSTGVTVRVCLSTPEGPLSGTVEVTASVANVGAPTSPLSAFGARRVIFTLDGHALLTDYAGPYAFSLPTDRFVDGTHELSVFALMRDSFTDEVDHATPSITVPLEFDNGIVDPPVNTNIFTPTSGRATAPGEPFVVAATGDGASGEPDANAVSDMIDAWDPNLFLYLGDVYEDGTYVEFLNWYGTTDTLWGRFRDVTNPTLGNHEYTDGEAPGYFSYWDNVPRYYSFDAHGWHFATLDSNSSYDGVGPGSAQFEWLRSDLALDDSPCTVVYLHHPIWSVGSQGSTARLDQLWDLLVGAGVDVVLTGHDHNYQRWQPLDADGVPHPAGPTQFVVGSGGHGIRPFATTDPRMVAGADTYRMPDASGSLRLALGENGASFDYTTIEGLTLDSGTIDCHDPEFEPGSIRNRISMERAALAALLPSGDQSTDDKVTEAIVHIDAALDGIRWSTDDRPADRDGHKVIEELKNAVHDLDGGPTDALLTGVMIRLDGLGRELAIEALAEALGSYGRLDELAKAEADLADGISKSDAARYEDALSKFRSSFEHSRKALEGAPDPWTSGVGHRGRLGDSLAAIWSLAPTGDGSDDDRIASAVAELTKVLDTALWMDENHPSAASDLKVPDGIKRAIDQLDDIKHSDVTTQMVDLVAVSAGLAQDALDAAIARDGDPKAIAEAERKIVEAVTLTGQGRYRDAADKYKQAYDKAQSA